jgi:predicted TIM-barrel fold metal-dependent hydrolase
MNNMEPIIDMHQHAMQDILNLDGTPKINPITGKTSKAITLHAILLGTIAEMDKHNIVKGHICGSNERLTQWVNYAPERFIPSQEISGNPPNPDANYVREKIQKGLIYGIGEITTQYEGMYPNDPKLEPYFTIAENLDVPVQIHTCGIGAFTPNFRCQAGNPILLEEVLVKHPNLRLCIAHAGYPFLAETISIMVHYPQVYADISAINWLHKRETLYDYLQRLMKAGYNIHPKTKHGIIKGVPIAKRLMYGSDQMCWPEAINMSIETIKSAQFLSEEQKRDIFYNNAARFLRLEV